jgi:hypothetical protein
MKIDLYTKAVLTVIAVCLVWMCLNGATPVVGAQAAPPEPAPVMLVDAKGNPLVTADAGLRVNLGMKAVPVFIQNDSLNVAVTNRALTVALGAIQRSTTWDPIQVQVMREPPTQRPIP